MKYLNFKLQNFKGIESLKIKISDKQPLCLVGMNESGKSTILEGIDLIGRHCELLSKKKSLPLLENGILAKLKPKKPLGFFFSDIIEFSCDIEQKNKINNLSFKYSFDNDKLKEYKVYFNKEEINFKEENWQILIQDLSKNIPKILLYTDFIFEVPAEIYFYTSVYLDKNEGHYKIAEKSDLNDKSNLEWKKILTDIACSLYEDKISFQEDIVDYLDGENAGSANNFADKLSGLSSHINRKITKKWLGNLGQKSALKEIVLKCNTEEHGDKRTFSFKAISNDNNTFDLSDRSKGCKWFFAFMLFTEFRKYRQENTIFLLDEPASNLHGLIQDKVVGAISDLCDKSSVIYTTHSPYLIDIKHIETIYSVKNVNSHSEIKPAKIKIDTYQSNANMKEGKPIHDNILLNLKTYKKTIPGKILNKYVFLKKIFENTVLIDKFSDIFK